jgi:hypothetical protein
MIKKLIEKIFGKFCKCEEPLILKEEQEILKEEQDFSKLTKGDIKKLKAQGKKWY